MTALHCQHQTCSDILVVSHSKCLLLSSKAITILLAQQQAFSLDQIEAKGTGVGQIVSEMSKVDLEDYADLILDLKQTSINPFLKPEHDIDDSHVLAVQFP